MPKWKKDATEFTVGVNHNEVRGYQTSIPKPVAQVLGDPTSVTFVVKDDRVEVRSGMPGHYGSRKENRRA